MNFSWQKRLVWHQYQFLLNALYFLHPLLHIFNLDVQYQLALIVIVPLILTASLTRAEVLVDAPPLSQFAIHCSHSEVTRVMAVQLHCIRSPVSFHQLVCFGILKIARYVIMGIFFYECWQINFGSAVGFKVLSFSYWLLVLHYSCGIIILLAILLSLSLFFFFFCAPVMWCL